MLNVYSQPENAQEIARLTAELERLKTELQVPPISVNAESYIFDRPLPENRPAMKQMFERVRSDIEKRKAAIAK